jgi:hypothetical protein
MEAYTNLLNFCHSVWEFPTMTQFWESWTDVNSVLGLLHSVDVGDVAYVSKVHTASISKVDSEDRGRMCLRNGGNISHIHTV